MAEQLSSIFNNSPHLTRSETMAYLDGKLSGSQLQRVEWHLADCEFCSDALEGLKLLNKEEAEKIIDDANEAIHRSIQPGKESRKFIRRWLAVAAVFSGLVVSSFFINYYLHKDKTELAQEIKPAGDALKENDSAGNESITLSKNENTASGLSQEKSVQKNEPVIFNDDTKPNGWSSKAPELVEDLTLDEENIGTVSEDRSEEEQSVPPIKVTSDSVPITTTVTVSGTTVVTQNNPDATYSWTPATDVEVISKTEKKSKNPITEARENYNSGNYDDALRNYKKTLSSDKKNPEANYFAGMLELKLKHFEKALSYFELVLAEPGNRYFADAQWQKALTLIEKGDKEYGQLLLNQIISESGAYKDSAQQKLNDLK